MMNEIYTLDETDLACIQALVSAPRASWRELSVMSNIPEKKLSRRIVKLFDEQIIRTVVELNPALTNKGYTVHVWISVEFGKEKQVADFFAQQPEVRVVFLTTGLADIFLEIGLEKPSDLSCWMHDFVTRIPEIKTVETHVVLKPFTWASKPKSLENNNAPVQQIRILSDHESRLIHELSLDGRAPIKRLAEQIELSEHKTQKFLNDLISEGVFNLRVDIEPELLGFKTEAIILIKAQPNKVTEIAKYLSDGKNTRCLFGISGDAQFFWHVLCDDLSDLWRLTTEHLQDIEGIRSCNINMVISAHKRAGFMRKKHPSHLLSL